MQGVKEYIDCMKKLKERFQYVETIASKPELINSNFALESIALHLRKILELIAFASISPSKELYSKIRKEAHGADYTKDFHARNIFGSLNSVNPSFYPQPFKFAEGSHEEGGLKGRKVVPSNEVYLTKKEFEKLYDRLGKYLHSDNPWGVDKGIYNFGKSVDKILLKIKNLLNLHLVSVRSDKGYNLWLVAMENYGQSPKMLIAGQA